MKLYLIRHGETVDNVAGVYAGVRDSQLTNHGVEQTKKLGDYFAAKDIVLTHIFASPLIRAFRTAEAIQKAQHDRIKGQDVESTVEIIKVHDLIEQDFGYYEGKPFHARQSAKMSGRSSHAELHRKDPDFVDAETKDAMARRADNFLINHFMPIVDAQIEPVVAIVSHGILLSTLWRRILLRIDRRQLSIAPEVTAVRGPVILEHLGGWNNTGYLELHFRSTETTAKKSTEHEVEVTRSNEKDEDESLVNLIDYDDVLLAASSQQNDHKQDLANRANGEQLAASDCHHDETLPALPRYSTDIPSPHNDNTSPATPRHNTDTMSPQISVDISPLHEKAQPTSGRTNLSDFTVSIIAIDSRSHLTGLKRQRGGIGRLANDEKQQKLDTFFKKSRVN